MNKVTLWNAPPYSLIGINVLAKRSASKVRMGAYENGVILFLKNACSFLADYTESIAPKELNLFCLFFQRKIDDYILDFYSDVYLRSPTSYDHSENFLKQSSDI
jgi:hypothetical protein